MRRFLALLAVLSLANVTLVRGLQACPVAEQRAPASIGEPGGHDGHAGHAMPGQAGAPVRPADPGDHPAPSHCLTMGACAVTLTLQVAGPVTGALAAGAHVAGLSERVPRSWESSPELPPPRA